MKHKPLGPQNDMSEDGDPVDPNWSARLIRDVEQAEKRVIIAPPEVRRWRAKQERLEQDKKLRRASREPR